MQSKNISRKDFLITLMLAMAGIFPGGIAGLHRIYCGKVWSGCVLAVLNSFIFSTLIEIAKDILNSCVFYINNFRNYRFSEILNIARRVFLENKGNFFAYCYIAIIIFLILDVVLLCLEKFKDNEGGIVLKTRIFANIKNNIKNRKKFGGNL